MNYQFSWKPHIWSKYYSEAPEIWAYLKGIEQDNDFIAKYVSLRHLVVRADWKDSEGIWTVKVKNLATGEIKDDHADVFLNGGGVLK